MGIEGLSKFIRDRCGHIIHTVHLSDFAFRKVAIDTSGVIFRYKTVHGDFWMTPFMSLILCLQRNRVHSVFIYDTGAPPEKDKEKQRRIDASQKRIDSLDELEDALEHYINTAEVREILEKFSEKQPRSLLSNRPRIDIEKIRQEIERRRAQLAFPTEYDIENSKKLFNILGIPFYQAPLEAETMCADLCKTGGVDAVLSEDTDVLAYGSPIMLKGFDGKSETCQMICYTDVLEGLELTDEQFLDFCIMCKCDYNERIKGLGPASAYNFIGQYGSIEGIEAQIGTDPKLIKALAKAGETSLEKWNYQRCRELFRDYERSEIDPPYCRPPDYQQLSRFCAEKNVRTSIETVRKAFAPTAIVFED